MEKLFASLFFMISTIAAAIFGLLPEKSAGALATHAIIQTVEINNISLSRQDEMQIQEPHEITETAPYAYGNPAGCGASAPKLTSSEMLANVQAQLPELDLASLRMDYIWNGQPIGYTVQYCDKIEAIAFDWKVSPQELANVNRISPDLQLVPGQTIILPALSALYNIGGVT